MDFAFRRLALFAALFAALLVAALTTTTAAPAWGRPGTSAPAGLAEERPALAAAPLTARPGPSPVPGRAEPALASPDPDDPPPLTPIREPGPLDPPPPLLIVEHAGPATSPFNAAHS